VWFSLKSLTPFVANRLNARKQMNQNEMCLLWSNLVISLFGKSSVEKFKPLYFRGKTLFVQCPNSLWANELQMRQSELLAKINSKSIKKIERIKFVF
jgi:predicted nucleic acid-binding Zn ribbon protein